MKLNIIVLLALLIVGSYQKGWIITDIPSHKPYCFNDDIPKHTRVLIEALTIHGQVVLESKFGHQNPKFDVITNTIKTIDFTTQDYGVHGFCFINQSPGSSKIKYSYVIGKRANDYSSNYQVSEFVKVLENQAQIAENFISTSQQINDQGVIVILHSISQSSYGFVYALSALFVLISIALIFWQYWNINNHLKLRKYI